MNTEHQFKRHEYKYYVPIERIDELRARFRAHMEHDPFCLRRPDRMYSVRSIYFDTRGLLFYFEKIDGQKVRKKLRIRCYDSPEDNRAAFLEIKRKVRNIIYKERAGVPVSEAPNLTNGARMTLVDEQPGHVQKVALDRFVYLVKRLNLQPTVLVTYEREAFRGLDESNLRVTFDSNVRSYANPIIDDLFREQDLRTFADPWFILEIKFFGLMPLWAREILRDFHLKRQAISKYCWGLDVWRPTEEVAGPE